MLPWATTEQDDRLLSDPHLLLLPLVTHGRVVPCFMFDQELTSADYPLRVITNHLDFQRQVGWAY